MKGFHGSYQVSSHGRIRSVDRKVKSTSAWSDDRIIVFKPGIIRKQELRILPNTYTSVPHYECAISLWRKNKETTMIVARLVYEHFTGPLKGLKVTHKDSDGRNNHYKNLMAVSDSEIRKRAYANGRQRSVFATMPIAQKKKIYKILSIKGMQAVQRLSESGKVVKNFSSIAEAAKDAPCDRNYMTNVLKGRKQHVKGKFYRYKP